MAAPKLSRKEKQEQTRHAILRSAATLFATKGVDGTSLEAIARHAGLTQGAIYSNFANKADLWWAIAEHSGRTIAFEEYLRGEESLRDELARLGTAIWHLIEQTSREELLLAQEFDLFLMRNTPERAKYARAARSGHRQLVDLLDAVAARRGEPLLVPAGRLARSIETIVEGLLHTVMLDPRAVDEELCVTTLAALASPYSRS